MEKSGGSHNEIHNSRQEYQCDGLMDIQRINTLSYARSPLIRCEIAEILAEHNGEESERILLRLLHDKNMLVRVESADSLSAYASPAVFHSLLCIIHTETYYLLKGYAILSFAQIGLVIDPMRTVEELQSILSTEKRCFIKLSCYEGLYRLGIYDSLENIFSLFETSSYRNRCAVLSSLEQLLDNNNHNTIKRFLQNKLPNENDYSVKNHIIKLLRRIEDGH